MSTANQNNTINAVSHKIVRNELEKTDRIKHIPATVIDVPEEKNNGVAKVSVLGRSLTLLNKTGEVLKENEGVIIYYWDNIANGYIALRCGLPVYKNDYSEGNDYTGELPVDEETTITNSYVLHEQKKETFLEYEYETTEESIVSDLFAITDYNTIYSTPTTDENHTDYYSVGSNGIEQIYWSSATIPTYSDISYNFQTSSSLNCSIIVNDSISYSFLEIVQDGTDVYLEITTDGAIQRQVMGTGLVSEYGFVVCMGDVRYHRKTNTMYYHATVRHAHFYNGRWHFIVRDWAFQGVQLDIIVRSISQTLTHKEFGVQQDIKEK